MEAAPLPPCVLFNCPLPGELEFNRRLLCVAHFEQLSRPSTTPSPPPPPPPAPTPQGTCALRGCKKLGVSVHNDEFFCRHHLTSVLLLDAHKEGKPQPVRYRHTKKQSVRLCQVGPCQREGLYPHGDILVCQAHAILLQEKERYIDRVKAADYGVDKNKGEISSRTQVCNFVNCTASNVTHKYHGVFCDEHLPVIDDLRNQIMAAKCHGDEVIQIPLRYNEIFLRKFLDERHVQYYNELVAKHGYGAPIVHVQGYQVVQPPSQPQQQQQPNPPLPPLAISYCGFPFCKKLGESPHGGVYYCHRHLMPVLVLESHIAAGEPLPRRTRVNKSGRVVGLCRVGHCTKNGNVCMDNLMVCKDHAVLLRNKEKFVDKPSD